VGRGDPDMQQVRGNHDSPSEKASKRARRMARKKANKGGGGHRQAEVDLYIRRSINKISLFNCALMTSDLWAKRIVLLILVTLPMPATWSIRFYVIMAMYVGLLVTAQFRIWRTAQQIQHWPWFAGYICSFSWREPVRGPVPLPAPEWIATYVLKLRESGRALQQVDPWNLIGAVLARDTDAAALDTGTGDTSDDDGSGDLVDPESVGVGGA